MRTTLWTILYKRHLTNHTADLKNPLFWLYCIFYCSMWLLEGQTASECWLHHYLWIIDLKEWNYGLISSRKWGGVSRWELALCCVWTFLASLCGLSRGLCARAVVRYDWSGAVGLAKPFCRTIWKERKSQWLFLRINCLLCNSTTVSRKAVNNFATSTCNRARPVINMWWIGDSRSWIPVIWGVLKCICMCVGHHFHY